MTEERKKTWNTCAYAITADGQDEMASSLRWVGINEIYGCKNRTIVTSGRYVTEWINTPEESLSIAWLKRTMVDDELTKERIKAIQVRVSQALKVCEDCAFHLPKDSKLT